MNHVEKILKPFLYVIRHQKKMVAVAFLSALFFFVLFFPYDDLSDLLTELIAKNSQNQIFVQFEDLGIGFLPPSIKMKEVSVDTPLMPTLKAGSLHLAPSIAGFLAFSPGFSVSLEDFMKGNVSLSYRAGKKINDNVQMQKVVADLSGLDLKSLSRLSGLPVELEGQIFVDIDAQVDPNFVEQPDGEVQIKILKFRLPSSTVPTMLGPASLPNTELKGIDLKGYLKGGELTIDESRIGEKGDTIQGRFKGRMGLRLSRHGGQIVPNFSSYEFKIDLNLDRAAEKNFGVFLSFYDKYKTVTGTGSRYALKLSGPHFQAPPQAAPLGTF